jgi:hypothetical protein
MYFSNLLPVHCFERLLFFFTVSYLKKENQKCGYEENFTNSCGMN